ncbi:MAG TPA: hypothetical protein VFA48_13765 [Gammaproteobacteria bacterium]|nr:hypothetical protein [Gammaproteobacteria bacterium]
MVKTDSCHGAPRRIIRLPFQHEADSRARDNRGKIPLDAARAIEQAVGSDEMQAMHERRSPADGS